MKAIKIIIAVVVLCVICFLVWWNMDGCENVSSTTPPIENPYYKEIDDSISSLEAQPVEVFSNSLYKVIRDKINGYSSRNRFSNNEKDNERYANILREKLFNTYAERFSKQAIYVLHKTDWANKYKEIKEGLSIKKMDEHYSPIDPDEETYKLLDTISKNISKYDEISKFITECTGYKYENYSTVYPDQSKKLEKYDKYHREISNYYVRNCKSLHSRLNEIPQKLYDKHVVFIENKISNIDPNSGAEIWSELKKECNELSLYKSYNIAIAKDRERLIKEINKKENASLDNL